ncbi:uncharacterized protein TNCV_589791 [Trichonephila clavipes]|nr:uncharacterized protein TNCV_589791 [Trichonephila clavipes]
MPLNHFGMPAPNHPAVNIANRDVQREHQFDMTSLVVFVVDNEQLLTAEERNVYDQINVSIAAGQGGFIFSGCTRWHWQNISHLSDTCAHSITKSYCMGNCFIRHCRDLTLWWTHCAFSA